MCKCRFHEKDAAKYEVAGFLSLDSIPGIVDNKLKSSNPTNYVMFPYSFQVLNCDMLEPSDDDFEELLKFCQSASFDEHFDNNICFEDDFESKSSEAQETTSSVTTESNSPALSRKRKLNDNLNQTSEKQRLKMLMKFPDLMLNASSVGDWDELKRLYHQYCTPNVFIIEPNMPPTYGCEHEVKMSAYLYQTIPDLITTCHPPKRRNRLIISISTYEGTYIDTNLPDDNLYNIFKSPYRYSMLKKEVCDKYDELSQAKKLMTLKFSCRTSIVLNKEMTHIEKMMSELKDMQVSEVISKDKNTCT